MLCNNQNSYIKYLIPIPTVYREDYLGALHRLTRVKEPTVFIRMLNRAQTFSHTLNGNDMEGMETTLEKSGAFKESNEGVLKIIK